MHVNRRVAMIRPPKADPRTRLVTGLLPVLRAIYRLSPEPVRHFLRDPIMRRYVTWRPIPLSFRIAHGIRIEGMLRDTIVSWLYFEGRWEPVYEALLPRLLRPGDVFVDVGANFGLYSLLASRLVGSGGAVYAIEASPTIYARLLRNLEINAASNVVAFNLAASDRAGCLTVYLGPDTNSGATSTVDEAVELPRRGAALETEVEAKPLWQIVPDQLWPKIAVIKIDVEGAEARVLEGLAPMLTALPERAAIIVELNRTILQQAFGLTPADVLAPFRRMGFIVHQSPDPRVALKPVADRDIVFNKWDIADLVLTRLPLRNGDHLSSRRR